MKHSFIKKSFSDTCGFCNRSEAEHGPQAQCEACDKTGDCEVVDTILMCPDCQALNRDYMSEEKQEERVKAYRDSIKMDENIRYHGDYYNAATVAIVELEKAVSQDEELKTEDDRKHKLAELIDNRKKKLQDVLIVRKKEVLEAETELVALQRKLNELVPSLRLEWRAKFNQNNISYKPPVLSKPAKVPTIRSKNPIDRMAANYAIQMKLQNQYLVFKDGNQLLNTEDKTEAEVKAKSIDGIVKEVSAIDRAKAIISGAFK